MTAGRLHAADALLPSGWARDVLIEWDAAGCIVGVRPHSGWGQTSGAPHAPGPVLPGMPNLHSHAFQRAFAGLAEHRTAHDDSFWSWRDRMYRVANTIAPETLEAVATHLFVEMLEAGYTSVCEFHYLHHDLDGRPYADPAMLATVIATAASRAGIGLTLLPVLYQQGGFGGVPPGDGQRRFITSTDALLDLVRVMRPRVGAGNRVGLALHSLRAVSPTALTAALEGMRGIDPDAPIHIHVAEQLREVEECEAWSGQRPVAWLLDHAPLDRRFCLVHATHLTADETRRAAATGAVAGLCPTTEANLGDGVFAFSSWVDGGGRWGVGSDSHITVDAADELRMLEYSQRLLTHRRNVGASASEPHVATALTLGAVAGGAAASGRPVGGLVVGQRADFVVLAAGHPAMAGLSAPDALAVSIFASGRRPIIDRVVVAGRTVVEDGRHPLRASSAEAFVRARLHLVETAARA